MMNKGGCILLNKNKEVCLVYRKKDDNYSFPKGHLEKNEDIVTAALRETEEETNHACHLINDNYIGINKYENQKDGQINLYMYIAIEDGITKKQIADKDKEIYKWFKFDEVEKVLGFDDLIIFWKSIKDKVSQIYDDYITNTPNY